MRPPDDVSPPAPSSATSLPPAVIPLKAPPPHPSTPDELAHDYLSTVLKTLRLTPALRRKAILSWHDGSALGGADRTSSETKPAPIAGAVERAASERAETDALARANAADDEYARTTFCRIAGRLRLPLKLSRVRLVARVLVILGITYADLVTDAAMVSRARSLGPAGGGGAQEGGGAAYRDGTSLTATPQLTSCSSTLEKRKLGRLPRRARASV